MPNKHVAEMANSIRKLSLMMIYGAKSGHPGGCLSVADILATLYFKEMNLRPEQPRWVERDRLILSKGHSCPALYAALALKGFFPVEELKGLRRSDHFLEGHPDVKIPGVDAPSGSLGMGLSQGLGMALGARFAKIHFRTYVVLGDGDMQEGSTWEAIMAAGHHKVSSLTALLDANLLQGDGFVARQMNYYPRLVSKISSFLWQVIDIDGHDLVQISAAIKRARNEVDGPTFIICRTTKGRGVSFMENVPYWQGSIAIKDEELEKALAELGGAKCAL